MRIDATQSIAEMQSARPSGVDTTQSKEDKALRKTCKDMESVFMGYLLKSMRKTVTKSDLFGSAREEEFFQDMLDSEVCSAASRTQSIGIADMLYRQLSGADVKHLQAGISETKMVEPVGDMSLHGGRKQ